MPRTQPADAGDLPPGARWRLRDGVRVVRRGRDRVQVGLDPLRRVVLPDDDRTAQLLLALRQRRSVPAAPDAVVALRALHRLRLVEPLPRRPVAADLRVGVTALGGDWPVDAASWLRAGGARVVRAESDADAVLVLSPFEPDRARLDPLLREGRTHLVLTLLDGGARLGPLVQPGLTACLRCVDLHHTEDDPDHLAVLTRYAEAQRVAAPETEPAITTDVPLVALVTGWAARDLLTHLRGEDPAALTASTTLTWHPRCAEPERRRWLRHPGCGCGWSAHAERSPRWSGTMEA